MQGPDQVPMFEELPVYQEDLDRIKAKRPRVNCLQEMIIEFMNEFNFKDADMIKATGIPWPTWHGWITGDVNCQMADNNLLKLWAFVNKHKEVSLEYLLYGIGEDGCKTITEEEAANNNTGERFPKSGDEPPSPILKGVS